MPKCSECGFLGRLEHATRELAEADLRYRKSPSDLFGFDYHPECHRQSDLFPAIDKDAPNRCDEVVRAINESHDCQRFTIHLPGRTPKDHEDMQWAAEIRSEMQADAAKRNALDQSRYDAQQAWNARIESGVERRHAIQLVAQFLLALLAVVAGLIGAKTLPWFNQA